MRQSTSGMTATQAASLTKPGDYGDRAVKGLHLRVRSNRRAGIVRIWCFRYRWRGKAIRIVMGRLPTMSLAAARADALRFREALDAGIDPRRSRPRKRPAATALPLSAAAASTDKHSIEHVVSQFSTEFL